MKFGRCIDHRGPVPVVPYKHPSTGWTDAHSVNPVDGQVQPVKDPSTSAYMHDHA